MNTKEKPITSIFRVADGLICWFFLACAVILFFSGPALLVFQAYVWLRYAAWPPFSILDGLPFIGIQSEWLTSPQDFLGVHSILNFFPLSIFLSLLGLVPAGVYSKLMEDDPF